MTGKTLNTRLQDKWSGKRGGWQHQANLEQQKRCRIMWDTIWQRCVMLVTWPVLTIHSILSLPLSWKSLWSSKRRTILVWFNDNLLPFLQNDFFKCTSRSSRGFFSPASFFIAWTLLLKVCPPNECILVTQIPVLNHHQYLHPLIPSHFSFSLLLLIILDKVLWKWEKRCIFDDDSVMIFFFLFLIFFSLQLLSFWDTLCIEVTLCGSSSSCCCWRRWGRRLFCEE